MLTSTYYSRKKQVSTDIQGKKYYSRKEEDFWPWQNNKINQTQMIKSTKERECVLVSLLSTFVSDWLPITVVYFWLFVAFSNNNDLRTKDTYDRLCMFCVLLIFDTHNHLLKSKREKQVVNNFGKRSRSVLIKENN